jgi:hypothetical protein
VANEQNLIPFCERSEEEQREMRQRGGVNSGVARRRKRSLREAADYYLSLPVSEQKNLRKIVAAGVDAGDVDNQMAIIAGLTAKAIKGDPKAAKVLLDLLGEENRAGGGEVQIIDDL